MNSFHWGRTIVHAVIDLDSGSLTVIGPEGPIHQGAIGEIAADQQCQANEKANHLELSKNTFFLLKQAQNVYSPVFAYILAL